MPFDTKTTHPTFGMIGVSHVSSSGTYLVGSEFRHHHYVCLRIHRSRVSRELNREWWGADKELIEVYLTESQFVELIGRPNMGDGVPCTLYRVAGEAQGDVPEPEQRHTLGRADMSKTAALMQDSLKETLASLENAATTGKIGKKELAHVIHSLKCQIDNFPSNVKYVADSFDKHMDESVNRAGVEIESMVSALAMRLGVDRLQEISDSRPKLIESTNTGDADDHHTAE